MNPQFVVIFRAKDALQIETHFYGPYATYEAAEEKVMSLPVARDCECKYISELEN